MQISKVDQTIYIGGKTMKKITIAKVRMVTSGMRKDIVIRDGLRGYRCEKSVLMISNILFVDLDGVYRYVRFMII